MNSISTVLVAVVALWLTGCGPSLADYWIEQPAGEAQLYVIECRPSQRSECYARANHLCDGGQYEVLEQAKREMRIRCAD